jgi:pectinesterase
MADADIYLVPTANTIQWGRRIYYYNCHREGDEFDWYANNIDDTLASQINAQWVFKSTWDPIKN